MRKQDGGRQFKKKYTKTAKAGEEDVTSIIPYDLDRQISYMEEVLDYDAAFAKMLALDERGGLRANKNTKIIRSWQQILNLKLSVSLLLGKAGHNLLQGKDMFLADKNKFAVTYVPTRKKNVKLDAQTGGNLNTNKCLAPIFAEGVFTFNVLLHAEYADPPADFVVTNCKLPYYFDPSKVDGATTYSLALHVDKHIEKYTLYQVSSSGKLRLQRKEQRRPTDEAFNLQLQSAGSYRIVFEEGLADGDTPAVKLLPRNVNTRCYLLFLHTHTVHLAECPVQKTLFDRT